MLNEVYIGEEGMIVTVSVPQGNVILARQYYLSADDACGYPEDFFLNVSEADLEEIGAEYLSGNWKEVA